MNIILILLALCVGVIFVLQLLKIVTDQRIINLVYGLVLIILIVYSGGWIHGL